MTNISTGVLTEGEGYAPRFQKFRKVIAKSLLLAAIAGWPVSSWASSADGLTDLLIEKGVITKEELKVQQEKRSLKISGRVQARYTWQESADPDADDTSQFSLPRVRLGASGAAFEDVKYKVEIDVVPDKAKGTKIGLKDAKLQFTQIKAAPITVGHFKVPFSRQELTSSSKQQFVNRAEVNGLVPGRDVGLMVGGYGGKPFIEYAVGAFNGTGTRNANDNNKFALAARVAVNPFGEFGYSESNLEGEDMKASVGVNVLSNKATSTSTTGTPPVTVSTDTDVLAYGIDAGVKFVQNASLFLEYIQSEAEPDGGAKVKSKGYYVQGGFFVLPKHLELVARFEQLDPDDSADDNEDITWTTVGVNYFFSKHDWKLQANYVMKEEDNDPKVDDDTFLLQMQVKF